MGILLVLFWPKTAKEQTISVANSYPYLVNRVLLSTNLDKEAQENILIVHGNSIVATQNPYTPETPRPVLNLPKRVKKGIGNGQCVQYAEYVTGIYRRGNANVWTKYINSTEPVIGSIVVLNEGSIGHLAAVKDIKGDSILITEQNYLGKYIISERLFSASYLNILGYVTSQ